MIGDVFIDRGDQVRNTAKYAATNPLVGDLAEPSLDHVQPGTRCWDEMDLKSRMAPQPRLDARMFVGCVIVHDQMQAQISGDFAVDLFEETNELLMPVPWHAVADDFAIEHAQSGEQSRRAVALVIVRHRAAAPLLDWQAWLCPIEGLDLAFLVDAQDHGIVWWIDVKANNIGELFEKVFITAELESLDQVRLEVMLLPDTLNRSLAYALGFRHSSGAPMSCSGRLGLQGGFNDGAHLLVRDALDAARTRSIFFDSTDSQSEKALSPQLHRWPRDSQPHCDILAGHVVSGHGYDRRTLNDPQGQALGMCPCGQGGAFGGRQDDWWREVHDA